jgi:hypothetical protein
LVGIFYIKRFPCIARPAASGARHIYIRQKLHIQTDFSCSVTLRTTQTAGIVGKIPRFIPSLFGIRQAGKQFAQFVMHIGIRCHGGTHINPNRGGINQLYLFNTLRLYGAHMGRKRRMAHMRL